MGDPALHEAREEAARHGQVAGSDEERVETLIFADLDGERTEGPFMDRYEAADQIQSEDEENWRLWLAAWDEDHDREFTDG